MVAQYHKIRGNEASIVNDIARCAPCHQPDRVNNNVPGVDSQFGHVNIRLSSPVPSGSMRYERGSSAAPLTSGTFYRFREHTHIQPRRGLGATPVKAPFPATTINLVCLSGLQHTRHNRFGMGSKPRRRPAGCQVARLTNANSESRLASF